MARILYHTYPNNETTINGNKADEHNNNQPLLPLVHPGKLNMEPQKCRFGRWFPYSIGWFFGSMLIFRGVPTLAYFWPYLFVCCKSDRWWSSLELSSDVACVRGRWHCWVSDGWVFKCCRFGWLNHSKTEAVLFLVAKIHIFFLIDFEKWLKRNSTVLMQRYYWDLAQII